MAGVALAVLAVAFVVGFIGRLLMPGRRGLLSLMVRDVRFLRRFVVSDVELRWEVGASVLGAVAAYVALLVLNPFASSASSVPWFACVIGSVVFTAIAMAAGVIERARFTRKFAA